FKPPVPAPPLRIAATVPAPVKPPAVAAKPPAAAPATVAPRSLTPVAPKPAPPTAVPTMASGAFVLQIGAFPSQADADAAWKTYKAKHAALLADANDDV